MESLQLGNVRIILDEHDHQLELQKLGSVKCFRPVCILLRNDGTEDNCSKRLLSVVLMNRSERGYAMRKRNKNKTKRREKTKRKRLVCVFLMMFCFVLESSELTDVRAPWGKEFK